MPLYADSQNPGVFHDPETGKSYDMKHAFEGAFYDTVLFGQGALTNGTRVEPFESIEGKRRHHTNLNQTKRIPGKHNLLMSRIAVYFPTAIGDQLVDVNDIIKLAHAGYMRLELGTKLVAEGLLLDFPAGFGLSGTVANTKADTVSGLVSNGLPSAAATRDLQRPEGIDNSVDLNCEIRCDENRWTAAPAGGVAIAMPTLTSEIAVMVKLVGLVTRPINA